MSLLRRTLISFFAFAAVLGTQLFSCGDPEPSLSELATCAGAPATAPVDNLAMSGQPDGLTRAVSDMVSRILTPDELSYLSQLDRAKLTGSNLYTDPVMSKAILATLPLVRTTCAQPQYSLLSLLEATAYAQADPVAVANMKLLLQTQIIISHVLTLLPNAGGPGICPAGMNTCYALMVIIAGGGIVYATVPDANEPQKAKAPIDPPLYCSTTNQGCPVSQAIQIASGQDHPIDVAAAAGELFWMNKAGGRPTHTLMKWAGDAGYMQFLPPGPIGALAIDYKYLFLCSGGDVDRVEKTGGVPERLGTANYASGIALDDMYLYWASFNTGEIYQSTTVGLGTLLIVSGRPEPDFLTASGGWVFWREQGRYLAYASRDDAYVTLVPNVDNVFRLTSVGGVVYFSDKRNLYSLQPGGTPIVISDAGDGGIISDGQFIYWESLDNTIRSRRLTGGAIRSYANIGEDSGQLAVDQNFIYYTRYSTGVVGRIAK